MASVVNVGKNRFAIQFTSPDKRRKTLRLPKECSESDAHTICSRVDDLRSSLITGLPIHSDTARWVAKLSAVMADKLAAVGLIEKRSSVTLGDFLAEYIAERTDVKPSTRMHLGQARQRLVDFFGDQKALHQITPGAVDSWVLSMGAIGLADNTIRRTCGRAKQFFRVAVRRHLIQENPFDGQKTAVGSNKDRFHFVTEAEAAAVIEHCPNSEWRCLFALSRWGGLRIPSEIVNLTWDCVDWDRGRLRVLSPKTEHLEGHAERICPLFPELRKHLAEAFDLAERGAIFILPRLRGARKSLRTQLNRIIRNAGLILWEKPFANCRSTRETELCEIFPLHVVTAWLGNSEAVAKRHYLQTTDAHFEAAIMGDDAKALKNPKSQVFAQPRKGIKSRQVAAQSDHLRGSTNHSTPRLGLEPRT